VDRGRLILRTGARNDHSLVRLWKKQLWKWGNRVSPVLVAAGGGALEKGPPGLPPQIHNNNGPLVASRPLLTS
jgi:hypothetical protein